MSTESTKKFTENDTNSKRNTTKDIRAKFEAFSEAGNLGFSLY
jgi:hypothetical protein